jgi:hypothetical protein
MMKENPKEAKIVMANPARGFRTRAMVSRRFRDRERAT